MALSGIIDYWRPAPPREVAALSVEFDGDTAVIALGKRRFFLRSSDAARVDRELYDFALFGAMILSLSQNVEIRCDLPVSRGAVEAAERLSALMELWQPRKIYPAPMQLSEIVDLPAPAADAPGLICLSGGIDSTYGAIEAKRRGPLTHGMLIAGADYPDAQNPGFVALRDRVGRIAAKLGLELLTVETSIRKHRFHWEMLHGVNLAMCLSLHRAGFGYGVISSDQTPAEELAHHPWGNTRVLVDALSHDGFPIRPVGWEKPRSQKAREVIAHESGVLQDVSVCYEDTSQGGNCGTCFKCIRTRLNILSSGQERPDLFGSSADLAGLVEQLPIPKHQIKRRKSLAVMIDCRSGLPDGAARDAVEAYIARLKRRIVPTGRS